MDESTSGIHALMAETFTLLKVYFSVAIIFLTALETRLLRLASAKRPGDSPAILPVPLDDAAAFARNANSGHDPTLGLAF